MSNAPDFLKDKDWYSPYEEQYPFGFFANMDYYPRVVPASETQRVLYCSFNRHDRGARIEKDQLFIDSKGRAWWIHAGDLFNGASIPRVFWRIFTPYGERMREASAFHDVYCTYKTRSQKETHYMFWEMQRANKVDCYTAWVTWAAVRVWCRVRDNKWA